MSAHVKIHQGTGRLTGESLCKSCANAAIIEEHINCQVVHPGIWIRKPVFNCTGYYNKALPSIRSMESIAWELRTSGGRKLGFAPPKKRQDEAPDFD